MPVDTDNLKKAADREAEAAAHMGVDEVKRALGERGPAWWDGGSPDFNRHMAKNTPYADWYAGAYVVSFSQALQGAVAGKGVLVQVVAPPAVDTDFWNKAGLPVSNYWRAR
jgi:hypothetical protein